MALPAPTLETRAALGLLTPVEAPPAAPTLALTDPGPVEALPEQDAHVAAVQSINEGPSSYVAEHRVSRRGAMDAGYQVNYQEWQDEIRRWARTVGLVRFVGSIVADALARCDLSVQFRDSKGAWQDIDEGWTRTLFDYYESDRHTTQELIRLHAWYYETVGDMYQVLRDNGGGGIDWMLYSTNAVRVGRRYATVMEIPQGSVLQDTAYVVPREQVTRFWTPDEEWQGLSVSPMTAVVNDLRLMESLTRYFRNTADSAVAMNDILWFPGEAVKESTGNTQGNEPGGGGNGSSGKAAGAGRSILTDYYEAAARRLTNADSVASVADFVLHWKKDFGPPIRIERQHALDPNGLAYLQDARESFGVGVNIPGQIVSAGGTADANHWTAWQVGEDYARSIAPIEERICRDLTRTFLWRVLRRLGIDDLRRYRIWYDMTPIIIRPDQSANAIALNKQMILGDLATLETCGFEKAQLMQPDEVQKHLQALEAAHATQTPGGSGGGIPVNSSNVVSGPPVLPAGPAVQAAAPPAIHVHLPAGQMSLDDVAPRTAAAARTNPRITAGNRALRRVSQSRRDTGRALRAAADLAFAEAVAKAGIKIQTRASARGKSREVQTRVAAAAERVRTASPLTDLGRDQALGAHLAAVGIKETELVAGAFGAEFQGNIASILQSHARAQRQALTDNAFDPGLVSDDPERIRAAAGYLAASLTALAIMRATAGHPLQNDVGEVSGVVPASFMRDVLQIADGAAEMVPSSGPDRLPDVVAVDAGVDLEQALNATINAETGQAETGDEEGDVVYTWNWGFYGDPTTPFEPHENLGASMFETTAISDDPALTNQGSFPDGDFYAPGDHDGCTCEWVPTIEARYAHEPAQSTYPDRSIPGLGGDAEQTSRALEAAGVA